MRKFLLALAFLEAAAGADCWTVRLGSDTVLVSIAQENATGRYVCYRSRLVPSRYACFSHALFATDELVGHLYVAEDRTSTLRLNAVFNSPSVWESEVHYDQLRVRCEPLTFNHCARRLSRQVQRLL